MLTLFRLVVVIGPTTFGVARVNVSEISIGARFGLKNDARVFLDVFHGVRDDQTILVGKGRVQRVGNSIVRPSRERVRIIIAEFEGFNVDRSTFAMRKWKIFRLLKLKVGKRRSDFCRRPFDVGVVKAEASTKRD